MLGGGLGDLVLRPPDLGEQQDGGADPGIGFEHAAGHGDHGFEFATFHQHLAQVLERAAGAEQHALRHDHAGGAAYFQQAVDVLDKQQFGLGGAQLQVFVDVALVDAAGKGRVGHHDVVFGFFGVALAEGVLVIDVRLVDAVHHQVHQPQAHHGGVDVVTIQELVRMACAFSVEGRLRPKCGQSRLRRAAGLCARLLCASWVTMYW